jgi:DNA polymerase-1
LVRASDRAVAREIVTLLLSKAKASTVRGIYARLEPGADGHLRYVLQPGATDTGRMACGDTFLEPSTNLQNLPNKIAALDPLYRVRDCIVPDRGRVLGEADLSQAEARVAAWMARDPLAMHQYRSGIDRYRVLAGEIYAKAPLAVSKLERQVGKMGQLAFQYGVGWQTFMEQVNADADITGITIDAKIAKRAEAAFRAMHVRYPVWWEEVLDEVLRAGFLRNPLGRRRDFFQPARTNSERAQLRRAAVAFLPQSTIADLLNAGLRRLYDLHDPAPLRVLLQVHDAVLFDCAPRDATRVAWLVKRELERVPLTIHGEQLVIPCEVEMSSTSWAAKRKVA